MRKTIRTRMALSPSTILVHKQIQALKVEIDNLADTNKKLKKIRDYGYHAHRISFHNLETNKIRSVEQFEKMDTLKTLFSKLYQIDYEFHKATKARSADTETDPLTLYESLIQLTQKRDNDIVNVLDSVVERSNVSTIPDVVKHHHLHTSTEKRRNMGKFYLNIKDSGNPYFSESLLKSLKIGY